MSLIKKLNQTGIAVSRKYPYINHGGCCVYAALVAEALLMHNIQSLGIVAAWDAEYFNKHNTIDNVRRYVKHNVLWRWQDHGVSFSHIGLEFEIGGKLLHYDTNGVKNASNTFDEIEIYKGRLQIDDMRQLARKAAGWNDSFNRRHIPAIRKIVHDHLAVDNS